MSVILLTVTSTVACAVEPAPSPTAAGHPIRRPDLLLVTIDTLRADHLPTDGYPRDTAPNLAQWAEHAIVFSNAQSTSSWTVPAVTSIVTGVAPPTHGAIHGLIVDREVVSQEAIPAALPILAEVLQASGYRTYGVTANGHLDPAHGFERGFTRYACLGFSATAEHIDAQIESWRDEIEAADQPVFVWLHYFDPHFEYHRRDPWFTRYQPDATNQELETIRSLIETWPALPRAVLEAPERYAEVGRSLYDSEINYWDAQFSGLLSRFPRLANAATIISADHGEEFFDHGSVHHGNNLHRETVRVPMLVRPPGGTAPRREAATVSILDIPVTLAEWAGAAIPAGWQGVPLAPETDQAKGDREVMAFLDRISSRHRLRALIGRSWKLIYDAESGRTWLYDLGADPLERVDLSTANPERTAAMQRRLEVAIAALPAPPGGTATVPVDAEQLEQLRKMGYVRD